MKGIAIEQRGGFALPAALLALVVVGALVTGGLYAAMEEDRSSANVEHGSHAFMAAEQGMHQLLGTKTKPYFQDSVGAVGTADTVGPVAVSVNGVSAQYTLIVQRLNSNLFKVDSEGEVTGDLRGAGGDFAAGADVGEMGTGGVRAVLPQRDQSFGRKQDETSGCSCSGHRCPPFWIKCRRMQHRSARPAVGSIRSSVLVVW